MGEFGASLFVAQRESVTIPVVIYRLLGDPGMVSYRQSLAMSVVLMLVCACGFIVIERLRSPAWANSDAAAGRRLARLWRHRVTAGIIAGCR